MQVVLLILINIIMATVFYLILRFRLENSVNDYREKKIRREMDNIISEFNNAAERNISILENRISVLKSLLDKTGNLKTINFNLNDSIEENIDINKIKDDKKIKTKENITSSYNIDNIQKYSTAISDIKSFKNESSATQNDVENENQKNEIENYTTQSAGNSTREIDKKIKSYFSNLKDWITDYTGEVITKTIRYKQDLSYRSRSFVNSIDLSGKNGVNNKINSEDTRKNISSISDAVKVSDLNIKFEKCLSQTINITESNQNPLSNEKKQDFLHLKEIEITNMFLYSEDKYLLISELHERGYTSDFLSKCSGIPVGEVNLVLDLNS